MTVTPATASAWIWRCAWTGLSDDRIRKLYRSYVMDHDERSVLRHRGKSPRQAAFFFRNAELNFQAAQLASLFVVYGLLCGTVLGLESRYRVGSLESGSLLCQAYEAYLALARRDELGIARCAVCGGVRLRDLLARRRPACANCEPPT